MAKQKTSTENEPAALARFTDFSKIGPDLINAAVEQQQRVVTQEIVNQVQQYMSDALKNEQLSKQYADRAALARERISAIENGEFTINAESRLFRFNEERLNYK